MCIVMPVNSEVLLCNKQVRMIDDMLNMINSLELWKYVADGTN